MTWKNDMLSTQKFICRLYNQLIIKFHCCVMERTTVYAVNPVCGNQMKPMTLKPKTLKNLSTLILLFLDPFSPRIVRYNQVITRQYPRGDTDISLHIPPGG